MAFDYDLFVLLTPGLAKQTFEYDGHDYTFQFGGFSQITDTNYLSLVYGRYGDDWMDDEGNWLPVYGCLTGVRGTTNLQTRLKIRTATCARNKDVIASSFGLFGFGGLLL